NCRGDGCRERVERPGVVNVHDHIPRAWRRCSRAPLGRRDGCWLRRRVRTGPDGPAARRAASARRCGGRRWRRHGRSSNSGCLAVDRPPSLRRRRRLHRGARRP
ncbi:hypothetical protein HK405_002439, partial [Cladochytrium tenue]